MTPEIVAGWSALVAAIATVIGAVTLVLFFARGEPWGRLNDVSSVVLMLAMIPVALVVGTLESETASTVALPVAALGIERDGCRCAAPGRPGLPARLLRAVP